MLGLLLGSLSVLVLLGISILMLYRAINIEKLQKEYSRRDSLEEMTRLQQERNKQPVILEIDYPTGKWPSILGHIMGNESNPFNRADWQMPFPSVASATAFFRLCFSRFMTPECQESFPTLLENTLTMCAVAYDEDGKEVNRTPIFVEFEEFGGLQARLIPLYAPHGMSADEAFRRWSQTNATHD